MEDDEGGQMYGYSVVAFVSRGHWEFVRFY